MDFRVHHILCTKLYKGLGYDGAFCRNMSEKVCLLREHPDILLTLVTDPDIICANCPNLREGNFCTNGDNHVKDKDQALLAPLHLIEHETYTYRELMEHAKAYLTEDVFIKSCSCCQWYKAGICKYEDFWSKQ